MVLLVMVAVDIQIGGFIGKDAGAGVVLDPVPLQRGAAGEHGHATVAAAAGVVAGDLTLGNSVPGAVQQEDAAGAVVQHLDAFQVDAAGCLGFTLHADAVSGIVAGHAVADQGVGSAGSHLDAGGVPVNFRTVEIQCQLVAFHHSQACFTAADA